VTAVALSPDGRLALSGGHDRKVRLWDLATGLMLGPPASGDSRVVSVAFGPENRCLIARADEARIVQMPAAWQESPAKIIASVEALTGLASGEFGQVRTLAPAEWRARCAQSAFSPHWSVP
jgi:hypothetical protein